VNKRLIFAVALALLLITGCAVLTVDVDVYTGPLANTEEVQTEQVISLVMGAKPLLVQLRDHLEVASWTPHPVKTGHGAEDQRQHNSSLQENLVRFRANDWYWAGFMAASSGRDQRLQNEHAIRVNDILVLYDDQTPETLATLVVRGAEIYKRFVDNYKVLFPIDNHEEQTAWSIVAKGFTNNNPVAKSSYKSFFVSEKGRRSTAELFAWLNTNYTSELGSNKLEQLDAHTIATLRANRLIANEAEKLFEGNATGRQAKDKFIRRIDLLIHAYDECRSALHDLALLSLRGVQETSNAPFASNRGKQWVSRVIAGFGATVIMPSTNWTDSAVNSCLESTLLRGLLSATNCTLPLTNPKAVRAVLEDYLLKDPKGVASDLIRLDAQLGQKGEDITSGYLSLESARLPGDLSQELAYLEQVAGSVLNAGRTPQGLETLIDEYLEVATNSSNLLLSGRSQLPEFTHLMDGLVAFGQKVATLGNTAFLLESGQSEEVRRYVSVLQYIGNSILVHVDELKRRKLYDSNLKSQNALLAAAFREASFTNSAFKAGSNALPNDMDAKDVLAHLLDSLRAQHIKTILDQPLAPGEKGVELAADKFTQAIDQVIQMKNNQIFLRPASAYLRSSYPATTLNLNESVGWGNQLERQAWRSVPVLGELLDLGGRARLRELRELDRQSWQNINRVRVTGAGNVNYAIAKDDVGNWYVKQYAADPTNIIRSARNLAMFSAGNAFGRQLSTMRTDGEAPVATNSPFAIQLDRATSSYLLQTTLTWESLSNHLSDGRFVAEVSTAWSKEGFASNVVDGLAATASAATATNIYFTALTNGAARLAKATAPDRFRIADVETLNVLHALKRYHDTVRPKLSTEDTNNTAAAQRAFTSKMRDFVEGVIEERAEALNRFDAAIDVIRGATEN